MKKGMIQHKWKKKPSYKREFFIIEKERKETSTICKGDVFKKNKNKKTKKKAVSIHNHAIENNVYFVYFLWENEERSAILVSQRT